MKKWVLIALFLLPFSVALAQVSGPSQPNPNVHYRKIKGGKNSVVIIRNTKPKDFSKSDCAMPAGLIGQHVRAMDGMKFKNPVRILNPGDPMTMDFSPNRLNVFLSEDRIIRQMRCG